MRKLVGLLLACLSLALAPHARAQSPSSVLAPSSTAWGRFEPGAWSRLKIVIETIAPDGAVSDMSTSLQTTTLVSIGDSSVELKVDAKVDVAGKTFDAPSQTVRQLFGGQSVKATAEVKLQALGDGHVTIEGKQIPCQIEQAEIVEKAGRTQAKIYYSATQYPHVLRTEVTTTDDRGETTSQSTGEVIALDMPYRTLAGETRHVAVWQETARKSKGAIERSLTLRSGEIPGGVVARWSKELDAEGHLVRRSTLELIDFGTEPAAP
ncbi:MAG: hypothetical protein KF708_07450 [Pirellulales bacterium]|nr:hypothetical protein [Pirellulales bacterium]